MLEQLVCEAGLRFHKEVDVCRIPVHVVIPPADHEWMALEHGAETHARHPNIDILSGSYFPGSRDLQLDAKDVSNLSDLGRSIRGMPRQVLDEDASVPSYIEDPEHSKGNDDEDTGQHLQALDVSPD